MTGRKRAKRAIVKKQRKNVILEMLGQENIVTVKLQRVKEGKSRSYSAVTYFGKLLERWKSTWPWPLLLSVQLLIPFMRIRQWTQNKGERKECLVSNSVAEIRCCGLIPSATAHCILTFLIYFWKHVLPTLALILVFTGVWVFCVVLLKCPVMSFLLMSVTFPRVRKQRLLCK